MVNFLQLPAYNPGNALDFRGLNSGIDSIREQNQLNTQNKLQQAQLGMQQERLGMEKEQHSAQMAQAQRQRGVEAMRSFAGHAQSIEKMTDPAQKSAAWSRLLASHPDRDNLPEIYRDPINGPRLALQEAQGFMGEADRAKLGLTKAQTAAAYAQADRARRENTETGLVPQYMVGPDGVAQPFVMNKKGQLVPVQMPQGMRALGPGGTAEARAAGTATGKAQVDLPKVQQNAATTLKYIDDVLNDPHLPNVTGAEAYLPTVRSTSHDTEARIAQLGGRAFLSAFENLKGGGQITEIEGKKATDALARLANMKQTDGGYKKALEDFRSEVMDLVRIAERRARGVGASQPPSAQPQERGPGSFAPPPGGGWSIQRVD